jgi:DNA polymerase-3 subunit beta
MQLLLPHTDLVLIATRAKSIVNAKAPTDLLKCVVLRADMTGLHVTASDQSSGLTYVGKHAATVTRPGTVAVDAAEFVRAAKAILPGNVTVSVDDKFKLKLTSGKMTLPLSGSDPADFPPPPSVEGTKTMTVDTADLQRAIAFSMTGAPPDTDSNPWSGVKLDQEGELVRFVGIDGLRAAYIDIPFTGEIGGGRLTRIPVKAMTELLGMLDGTSGPVSLDIANRSATFRAGNSTLYARMYESDVPDYRAVIPKSATRVVTVDREELTDRARRIALMMDTIVTVKVGFSAEAITITSPSGNAGAGQVDVAALLNGEPIEIGVNVRSLVTALSALTGSQVVIEMTDGQGLILLRDPEEDRARLLLAPCRIDGM